MLKMVKNGQKWSKMVKMVKNGQKWSNGQKGRSDQKPPRTESDLSPRGLKWFILPILLVYWVANIIGLLSFYLEI